MSKALIGIVGQSGTGKSSSLEGLPPEATIILDLERKGFPFKGINRFRVVPINNVADYYEQAKKAIETPGVKYVVHESLTKFFELLLSSARRTKKGYDIYSFFNESVRNFFDVTVKNEKAVNIFTAIDEIVKVSLPDGGEQSLRRIKVAGKEHEGMIEKELLMVLFTEVRKEKPGAPLSYCFQTNTDGITSAKTPRGMFSEQYISNDLASVIKKATEYYTGESDSIS